MIHACRKCNYIWQLSSAEIDTQCDKLATVVGRTKLTIHLQRSAFDRRPLIDQFITMNDHLCVQHDARELARRAGRSATADIFFHYCQTCLSSVSPSVTSIRQ